MSLSSYKASNLQSGQQYPKGMGRNYYKDGPKVIAVFAIMFNLLHGHYFCTNLMELLNRFSPHVRSPMSHSTLRYSEVTMGRQPTSEY